MSSGAISCNLSVRIHSKPSGELSIPGHITAKPATRSLNSTNAVERLNSLAASGRNLRIARALFGGHAKEWAAKI